MVLSPDFKNVYHSQGVKRFKSLISFYIGFCAFLQQIPSNGRDKGEEDMNVWKKSPILALLE